MMINLPLNPPGDVQALLGKSSLLNFGIWFDYLIDLTIFEHCQPFIYYLSYLYSTLSFICIAPIEEYLV